MFSLADEPSIGLHGMVFSDGPTGVRGAEFVGGRQVALFPNATVLAQTWDETAAQRVGELLAGEALAQGVHVVLGPTVNLHRSPLGGRLFEAYAEDPLLSGRLAAAYLRGIQRYGVGGCVKHYVANESETERHTVTPGSARRRCGRSTCCPSRSAWPMRIRGRSWPPTTTSTAWPRPSTTS